MVRYAFGKFQLISILPIWIIIYNVYSSGEYATIIVIIIGPILLAVKLICYSRLYYDYKMINWKTDTSVHRLGFLQKRESITETTTLEHSTTVLMHLKSTYVNWNNQLSERKQKHSGNNNLHILIIRYYKLKHQSVHI